jgi:hypothetical protein
MDDNFDELSNEDSINLIESRPKVEQVNEDAFLLTDIQSQLD